MIIIHVAGTPGSGKTTLGRLIAKAHPQAIIYDTDSFIQGDKIRQIQIAGSAARRYKKWHMLFTEAFVDTIMAAYEESIKKRKSGDITRGGFVIYFGSLDHCSPNGTYYNINDALTSPMLFNNNYTYISDMQGAYRLSANKKDRHSYQGYHKYIGSITKEHMIRGSAERSISYPPKKYIKFYNISMNGNIKSQLHINHPVAIDVEMPAPAEIKVMHIFYDPGINIVIKRFYSREVCDYLLHDNEEDEANKKDKKGKNHPARPPRPTPGPVTDLVQGRWFIPNSNTFIAIHFENKEWHMKHGYTVLNEEEVINTLENILKNSSEK
jgi:hypothetical protein